MTTQAPDSVVQALNGSSSEKAFRRSKVLPDITLADAESALIAIEGMAGADYPQWMLIGQALKAQFPDKGEEAFDLFNDWSKEGANYTTLAETRTLWDSFDKGRTANPVTFRHIIALATEAGWKKPEPAPEGEAAELAATLNSIGSATTQEDLTSIVDAVRSREWSSTAIESLLAPFIARTHFITAVKPSKAKARTLLAAVEKHRLEHLEVQDWYAPYLYVEAEHGSLYHTGKSQSLSVRVFDAVHARDVKTVQQAEDGEGSAPASTILLNAQLIPVVRDMRYMPGQPLTFEHEGSTYGNTYRKLALEAVPAQTRAQHTAVAMVRQHFVWMLGEGPARLLEQFLAHAVQHPGDRVRWCYLVIGPMGIGKTFIGQLARAVLGTSNVKDINQATLSHTTFNGWAVGSLLTVIEEIKVDGARKWEIMNSLKAVISNDVIDVHAKGKEPYNAVATSNFLAFSNDRNAISPTMDDRRYYVTSTLHSTVEGFKDALGDHEAYFKKLYSTLKEYPQCLLYWLQGVDLDAFPAAAAPASQDKREMAEASRADVEVEIEAQIAAGESEHVTAAVVSLNALRAQIAMTAPHIRGQVIARVLRDLGYQQVTAGGLDPFASGIKGRWYMHPDKVREWGKDNGRNVTAIVPVKLIRMILAKE